MKDRYDHLRTVIFVFIISLLGTGTRAFSQMEPIAGLVNPMIGTTKSLVPTRWGAEGGTYPGAVVPWGFFQLTPETRLGTPSGYDYEDRSIYYFSCIHHPSGYPNGSSGRISVMPVNQSHETFQFRRYKRNFQHGNEQAIPGYYRVQFPDDQTVVETTATTRTGFFRFTFSAGVHPQIFVGDMGEIKGSGRRFTGNRFHAVFLFDQEVTGNQDVEGGRIFTFAPASGKPLVICLKMSASGVGFASAQRNLDVELPGWNFDQVREQAFNSWNERLSVVEVKDSCTREKRIFYTALYHSLLVPVVISDVDGNYRGDDGKVHSAAAGKLEYGLFSPWDTFRTLHPLLSLLFPDVQEGMTTSLLNVFSQTGRLPSGPMTGNHAIPVIVDSYLKGIGKTDPEKIWQALEETLEKAETDQKDRKAYLSEGYIPDTFPESVTRTVEYAYDDWAMAQFARLVMKDQAAYEKYSGRGYNYQHLIDPSSLFLLPRRDSVFFQDPGTFGYKEGDQWIYTYFAPQHPEDLINRLGEKAFFAGRLDSALRDGRILFDNETVLHLPWLFNFAGQPDKTQYWIDRIRQTRYSDEPGGLPGNDDLGSMSAWYVFSAMGFYPFCPGNPVYSTGSPLFEQLRIHLSNGKVFEVKRDRNGTDDLYVRSLLINGRKPDQPVVLHEDVMKGGAMIFGMGSSPATIFEHDPDGKRYSRFSLTEFSVSPAVVHPNEIFRCRFTIVNQGQAGTRIVRLMAGDRELGRKNCFVPANSERTDSISCRLFRPGRVKLRIDDQLAEAEVVLPHDGLSVPHEISHLVLQPVCRKGEVSAYSYAVQNTGGLQDLFIIPVKLNGKLIKQDRIRLEPGEQKTVTGLLTPQQEGMNFFQADTLRQRFKVYSGNTGSTLFDLSVSETEDHLVPDRSGLLNNGCLEGKPQEAGRVRLGDDCFISLPKQAGITVYGNTLTMMIRVLPSSEGRGSADLFSQGDFNVLQVQGDGYLNFFAGGWGRGECRAKLPDNWAGRWHQVTGVCNERKLQLFIDGELKAETEVPPVETLQSSAGWVIGRNEEFPGERIFHGQVEQVRLFTAPLTAEEIAALYRENRDKFDRGK